MKVILVTSHKYERKQNILAMCAREGTVYGVDSVDFPAEVVATVEDSNFFTVDDGSVVPVDGLSIEPEFLYIVAVENNWYHKD